MSARTSLFRKKILVSFIVFVLIAFLVLFRESDAVRGLRSSAMSLFQPLMKVVWWVRNSSGLFRGGLGEEEARRLLEENQRLKASAAHLGFLGEENEMLRTALGLKERIGLTLQIAVVRLFSKERGREFLIIDLGRESGIQEGDMVLDGRKIVVGTVEEAGDGFSKVTIAGNVGSAFEVTLIPLEARALARGLGGRAFSVDLVPVGTPLFRGDFITLPLAGVEEPLLLAQVVEAGSGSSAAFQNVRAVMLARPELLRKVLVLPGAQK